MLKELLFYFLALVLTCVFGYLKKLDWTFCGLFFGLYISYLITTIIVDLKEGK